MLSFGLNWIAVVVAVVVAQVLGFLWYGNVLFAKPWMKALGKTAKQLQAKSKPTDYAYTVIGALVMVIVLANVLGWANVGDLGGAVMVAVVLWLGFVVPPAAMNTVFEGRPWSLFWINHGYSLANMVISAIILTLLG
jgi:hypothetical protein